jgi:hypothetical protein
MQENQRQAARHIAEGEGKMLWVADELMTLRSPAKIRAGSRTSGTLIEAMGRTLDAVASRDARGFFEHCGYRLPA